jgi:hypothetical protein
MKGSFLIIVFILFLALAAPALANGPPQSETVMNQGFEGDFPPEGWILEHSNPAYTWAQVESAFDDTITAAQGEKFIYIEGPPDTMDGMTLISEPILNRVSGFFLQRNPDESQHRYRPDPV